MQDPGKFEKFVVLSTELHPYNLPESQSPDTSLITRVTDAILELTSDHVGAHWGPFMVLPFIGTALNVFRHHLPEEGEAATRHILKLIQDCSRKGVQVSVVGPDMLPTFGSQATSVLAELLIHRKAYTEAIEVLEQQIYAIRAESGSEEDKAFAVSQIQERVDAAIRGRDNQARPTG